MTSDDVRRGALLPAVVAPVALIGGWTLAARLQPTFDATRSTISALAETTATAPAVMTTGLALTGLAHVGTAWSLRPVARPGRAVHALGGLATVTVAALPNDTQPAAHGIAAGIAFGALAVWPALGVRRGARGVLRPAAGIGAAVVLLVLLAAFVHQQVTRGPAIGATERLLAAGQALWPLAVAFVLTRRSPRE